MATNTYYVTTGVTPGGAGTVGDPCASLSDAEGVAGAVGSATDDYIINCRGSTADTAAVIIDFSTNITTGSVTVRANTGEADGFYDGDAVISTSHYRLDSPDTFFPLRFNEARCTADGLQIIANHSGAGGFAVYCASSEFTVRKCRLLNGASCDYGIGNTSVISGSVARTVENNLIVGFDLGGIAVLVTNFFTPTVTIQHNTIYGDGSSTSGGIRYGGSGANSGTIFNIKGNAVGNCGSGNDLIKVSAASSTDNFDDNAFEYSEGTSGEIALGTLTDAWTSPGTSASSDFTIKDASSPLNFTVTGTLVSTDIRGTTRSNYSVGAFEFATGGTTYNEPITESVTSADALSTALTVSAPIAEAVTAGDALSTTLTVTASVAESVTASDALTAGLAFADAITETVTAADSIAATASIAATLAEAGSAADALAAQVTISIGVTESVTATDAISQGNVYADSFTETVTASDALTTTVDVSATLVEALSSADSLVTQLQISVDLSESVSAADSYYVPSGAVNARAKYWDGASWQSITFV